MINDILFALWIFLPNGISNIMAVVAAKLPYLRDWNTPLDMGKSVGGVRIFGDHKTVRGLVFGVLCGTVFGLIQKVLVGGNYDALIVSVGVSFGAIAGDAIKSFFKRRVGIASGETWVPFDQIDYVLGGLVMLHLIYPLSVWQYLAIFLVYGFFHPVFTWIGYLLKLKKSPL